MPIATTRVRTIATSYLSDSSHDCLFGQPLVGRVAGQVATSHLLGSGGGCELVPAHQHVTTGMRVPAHEYLPCSHRHSFGLRVSSDRV
eukprot:652689-Rhodomonas_salina.2